MKEILTQTTLYYFFSTLAQVIAAAVALIAVLVHFRILALRDFLVGDGQAIIFAKDENRAGYDILDDTNLARLKDAVWRKDIGGIKNVLTWLAQFEQKNYYGNYTGPRGFQWLLNHFEHTENEIKKMSDKSKKSFIFALITSFYSVISILFVEVMINNQCFLFVSVVLILILIIICLYYFITGIKLAFSNFTERFVKN